MSSTTDGLCDSHVFQHKFQLSVTQRCALCWKFLASRQSPDMHSLLIAVIPFSHWLVLYTPAFEWSHSQKSRRLKSGDQTGQLTGPPYPTHYSQKSGSVLSDNAEKMRWCNIMHGCVIIDEQVHVPRVLENHSPGNDGTLNRLVCWVRQLVQRPDHPTGPQRHWWKIDADVLMWQWCGDCHPPRHGYYESSPYTSHLISKSDVS